MMELEMRE